jgi:cell division protease FtsH
MVCEFGMTTLGKVAFKSEPDGTVLISPETAAKIDAEVTALVEQAYSSALNILREKKEKLITISEHLIKVETIDGTELDTMLFAA